MLNASDGFKEKMKTYGRQIGLELKTKTDTYFISDIINAEHLINNELFKSVMRMFVIELDIKDENENTMNVDDADKDSVNIVNTTLVKYFFTKEEALGIKKGELVNIRFGVRLNLNEEYEFIDLGQFRIYQEPEYKDETNSVKLYISDLMIDTMIDYDLNVTFPLSVRNYINAICNRLGFTFITKVFINSDNIIESDPYLGKNYTFRYVLDNLSEVVAGNICAFNKNMYVKYPTETGEIINEHDLKTLTIKETFGSVNTVIIGLPKVDEEDEETEEGKIVYPTEIIDDRVTVEFYDNLILAQNPNNYIVNIYNQVKDLSYTTFELTNFGFMYYEFGDIVTLKNKKGKTFKTIVMNNIENVNSGVIGKMYTNFPEYTKKEYKYMTTTEKEINKIETIYIPQIQKSAVDVAIEVAREESTILLTEFNEGYVIKKNGELYITDNPILEEAQKLWKWGLNGLGYSSNGINGPYGTAITMNGSIVADYITTGSLTAGIIKSGEMSADRISGGTLKIGGNNDINGVIEVLDANANLLVRIDTAGITMKNGTKLIGGNGVLSNFQFMGKSYYNDFVGFMPDSQSQGVIKSQIKFDVFIPSNFIVTNAHITLYHAPVNWYSSFTNENFWGYCRKLKSYKIEDLDYMRTAMIFGEFSNVDDSYLTEIENSFGAHGFTANVPTNTSHPIETVTSLDISSALTGNINTIIVQTEELSPQYSEDLVNKRAYERTAQVTAVLNVIGYMS